MVRFTLLTFVLLFSATNSLFAEEISAKFERYEGSKEKEAELTEKLAGMFGLVQQASATNGQLHRGTHAKGVCANAEFEVYDLEEQGYPADVLKKLQLGVYKEPGKYPGRVRFANGGSAVKSDKEADVRSLSFAVNFPNGKRQDYSMNSTPIFPIPSLGAFNTLIESNLVRGRASMLAREQGLSPEAIQKAGEDAVKAYLAKKSPEELAEFARVAKLGAEVTAGKVASYRTTPYWSGTAFKQGEDNAVKYIAEPCKDTPEVAFPENPSSDYLQEELTDYVSTNVKPVCFEIKLQFVNAEKMELDGKKLEAWQWVEDPTLDWDACGGTEIFTVGRLTVTPNSVYPAADCDDPSNAFNVMENALPEHKGMGRINRGRTKVEERSRQNRASR